MKFEQHPLSAAFPAMSAEDFQALKDDIEVNGQREPVMIFDNMVLDGWHRYRACVELGIQPTRFPFDSNDDPVAFVEGANLHRRHLTASQRAIAIVATRSWAPAGRPKKNMETVSTFSKRADLSKAAQVTPRTITDAKTVLDVGLGDVVRDGGMTVNQAAKIARGTVSKPKPAVVEPTESDEDDPIAILSDENDRLNDRLAVVAMDATPEERTAAADTIEDLRAQVKTLTATLAAVTTSRDSYMRENQELKKQCAGYKRQLDKIKKG